jgi:FHA domain-containing protein
MLGIRVVSLSGTALDTPLSATFGDAGGDIGRAADCTLVLADPERRISRRQVVISWRDGGHYIRQVGANLEVELDGVALARDVDYTLNAGARLRIGPYALLVERSVPTPTPAKPDVDLAIAPAPEAAPPSAAELYAALYAGLGLSVPTPSSGTTQDARRIGRLLRGAIEGTLGLLATRSIAKRELGGGATLPRPIENNPLKFAPNVDTALTHLLGPAQRGFIEPLAAVTDAFSDLRAHEIAVLTGMRAALNEVLARFDPAALEPLLAPKAMWENRFPGIREAKLWAQFGERYAELARDIEGEFASMFGRAFIEAYEEQLDELSSSPPGHRKPVP